MRRLLLILALACLSGLAHGQSPCGPPSYPCFVSDALVHNYILPIPSWGPNTCDSTSMYTMQVCGNMTGSGVSKAEDLNGLIMTRITDINVNAVVGLSNPKTKWQTADEPSVMLWNSDETAFMLLVNGGNQFIFLNTSPPAILTPRVSFAKGTIFSRSANNHIYTLDNTGLSGFGNGIYLIDNTINLTQGSGAITSRTQLFDFAVTTCLQNSVNGNNGPTDAFPLNAWTGALTTEDGVHFYVPFSLLTPQGGGYFNVRWTVGESGCQLWNTKTGTVTQDGVLLGTIPNTEWGGANGGIADRFLIHDGVLGNPTYSTTDATSSGGLQFGTYAVGDYIWDGTTNEVKCGIGAPDWKAGHFYAGTGDRILPIPTSTNAGGYIYQIVNGVGGTSSCLSGVGCTGEPTWNQTPGSNTSDGPLTWHNVGIGSVATPTKVYACDGHTFKGFTGLAAGKNYTWHGYTDPTGPLVGGLPLKLGPPGVSSAGDQHLGNNAANSTDTNWIQVVSSDNGTVADLLHGTLPSAIFMENFFVSPPYQSPGVLNCANNGPGGSCPNGTLGQLRRASHAYNSGWSPWFDTLYNMSVISPLGNYMLMSNDGMGQFGSTDGTAGNPSTFHSKCNVGGPNWYANFTAAPGSPYYQVGTLIYPNVGQTNSHNYIYRARSCGSSNVCTTGATPPVWTQTTVAGTALATLDGTIQWETAPDINNPTITAIENCRPDVMLIKLTTTPNPPPPPPQLAAPAITMFAHSDKEHYDRSNSSR